MVHPYVSKQNSAQPKSMEIYTTVFKIVLIGFALTFRVRKDICYVAGSPDASSGMRALTGSTCRKRKALDSILRRLYSEAERRKKVTKEMEDWSPESQESRE